LGTGSRPTQGHGKMKGGLQPTPADQRGRPHGEDTGPAERKVPAPIGRPALWEGNAGATENNHGRTPSRRSDATSLTGGVSG